jgi:hypothetical protein
MKISSANDFTFRIQQAPTCIGILISCLDRLYEISNEDNAALEEILRDAYLAISDLGHAYWKDTFSICDPQECLLATMRYPESVLEKIPGANTIKGYTQAIAFCTVINKNAKAIETPQGAKEWAINTIGVK